MPKTDLMHHMRVGMGKLADKYRQHRKTVNENLGLIIALAASCAAVWTGYEARHARLEARTAVEQSLKVQQESVQAQTKSVDAQIASMRLEQRPYVRVTPGSVPAWQDSFAANRLIPHSKES
jgi:hypothetical protein